MTGFQIDIPAGCQVRLSVTTTEGGGLRVIVDGEAAPLLRSLPDGERADELAPLRQQWRKAMKAAGRTAAFSSTSSTNVWRVCDQHRWRSLEEITARGVVSALDGIAAEYGGGPQGKAARSRCMRSMREFTAWLVQNGHMKSDPLADPA
jgi:hypothetical protein